MITKTLFFFLTICIIQVSGKFENPLIDNLYASFKNFYDPIKDFFIVNKENFTRVNTSLGLVKGYYRASYKNRQYIAYEGIPYAKPPVRNLRFKPPVPIEPWSGDLNVTRNPKICIQYDVQNNKVIGFEDCLYLNIYVPTYKYAKPYPVIVYIHGSDFQQGNSLDYRPTHILDKNVILVTINYRLGAFGFLSTGDQEVLGNMGLKDQSLALKWINDNIKYFDGDKKRITLTGCSAGGSSVHYHYLSPMSAGLFRNGISSSGTALSPWAFDKNPLREAQKLANFLQCNTTITEKMLKCLQQKSAEEICEATDYMLANEIYYYGVSHATFRPVAEKTEKNYFINRSPKEILKSKKFYDVPWIAGTVSGEGTYFTQSIRQNQEDLSNFDQNWDIVGPHLMMFQSKIPESQYVSAANEARKHYLGNKSFVVDDETTRGLINLIGDIIIRFDVQEAVRIQANLSTSHVRLYYFDFDTKGNSKYYGTPHCAECFFVLSNDDFNSSANQEHTLMLERMVQFVYYVASGDDDSWMNFWPNFDSQISHVQYISVMGPNNIFYSLKNDFAEKKFWQHIF